MHSPSALAQRIRVTYARGDALRFISHQDEFRMWERALRRTHMPLAYKNGFNPQPHILFAAPLGLGFSGRRELMDFRLEEAMPPAEIQDRLAAAMPPGVEIRELVEIPLQTPALTNSILGADYVLRVDSPDLMDGAQRVAELLTQREIWRTRQRKGRTYQYNLRPLIHALTYRAPASPSDWHEFHLRVQMLQGATGRPDEVLDELGLAPHAHVLERVRLYFSTLPDDAAVFAPYALASQADVTHPDSLGSSRRRKRRERPRAARKEPEQRPQEFGAKAADEFR